MKLDPAISKAFAILQKISPSLNVKYFLDTLRPIFAENKGLSKEEIKAKMLEFIIKEKPFGDELAETATEIDINTPFGEALHNDDLEEGDDSWEDEEDITAEESRQQGY